MRKRLSLLIFFLASANALAADGKVALDIGYFAISAKANGESSSISNPSAFRVAYLKPLTRKLELNLAYSLLLADFSGSDLGYGLDVGGNFYFLNSVSDDLYKDDRIEVRKSEEWRPYVGLNFHQRNFQSVKNSYAGFGVALGTEKYLSEKLNLRAEARSINLSGSGKSKATETGLFFGVVFKL